MTGLRQELAVLLHGAGGAATIGEAAAFRLAAAAQWLGALGASDSAEVLLEMVTDTRLPDQARAEAAASLGVLGNLGTQADVVCEALARTVRGPGGALVKQAAARTLGTLGSSSGTAALLDVVRRHDGDPALSVTASIALGWVKPSSALARALAGWARQGASPAPAHPVSGDSPARAAEWALTAHGHPPAQDTNGNRPKPPRLRARAGAHRLRTPPGELHSTLTALLTAPTPALRLAGLSLASVHGDARLLRGDTGTPPLLLDIAETDPHFDAESGSYPIREAAREVLRRLSVLHDAQYAPLHTQLLCPYHLTRFRPYAVRVPGHPAAICYGCRVCGRTLPHIRAQRLVVLVGSTQARAGVPIDAPAHGSGDAEYLLRWRSRRQLADFDEVEINAGASDWQVMKFLMTVSSDSDSSRLRGYRLVPCVLPGHHQLSDNTVNALRDTFRVRLLGAGQGTIREGGTR